MAVPVSETPTVSVLICTKDRRADVARALASLRADGVDREGVEIVVIEETAEPAPMPGVRYVTVPPEGRGFRYLDAAGGRVVPTAHLSTCNCAYRREAIETVGGFSPLATLGGEDSL